MASPAGSFAARLLAALRARDPLAHALDYRARGKVAVIGLHDAGAFLPLLKLDAASAAFNVMSLFVYHRRAWSPTCLRGTPAGLVEPLTTTYRYLWAMATQVAEPPPLQRPGDLD